MAEEVELGELDKKSAEELVKNIADDGTLHITLTCHGKVWQKDELAKVDENASTIDTASTNLKYAYSLQYYVEDGEALKNKRTGDAWGELCSREGPDYAQSFKVGPEVSGKLDYNIELYPQEQAFPKMGIYFNPKGAIEKDSEKANQIEPDITWWEICQGLTEKDIESDYSVWFSDVIELLLNECVNPQEYSVKLEDSLFPRADKIVIHCHFCRVAGWAEETQTSDEPEESVGDKPSDKPRKSSTQIAKMPSDKSRKSSTKIAKMPSDKSRKSSTEIAKMPSEIEDPLAGTPFAMDVYGATLEAAKKDGKTKSFTEFDASKQRGSNQTNMSQGGQLDMLVNSMYDSMDCFVDYAEQQERIIEKQNSRIAALERELLQQQGSSSTTATSNRRRRRRRGGRQNPSPPMGDYKEIWT